MNNILQTFSCTKPDAGYLLSVVDIRKESLEGEDRCIQMINSSLVIVNIKPSKEII